MHSNSKRKHDEVVAGPMPISISGVAGLTSTLDLALFLLPFGQLATAAPLVIHGTPILRQIRGTPMQCGERKSDNLICYAEPIQVDAAATTNDNREDKVRAAHRRRRSRPSQKLSHRVTWPGSLRSRFRPSTSPPFRASLAGELRRSRRQALHLVLRRSPQPRDHRRAGARRRALPAPSP